MNYGDDPSGTPNQLDFTNTALTWHQFTTPGFTINPEPYDTLEKRQNTLTRRATDKFRITWSRLFLRIQVPTYESRRWYLAGGGGSTALARSRIPHFTMMVVIRKLPPGPGIDTDTGFYEPGWSSTNGKFDRMMMMNNPYYQVIWKKKFTFPFKKMVTSEKYNTDPTPADHYIRTYDRTFVINMKPWTMLFDPAYSGTLAYINHPFIIYWHHDCQSDVNTTGTNFAVETQYQWFFKGHDIGSSELNMNLTS